MKGVFIENPYTKFHIYAAEWKNPKIYFTLVNESRTVNEWPSGKLFYPLLNIAVTIVGVDKKAGG